MFQESGFRTASKFIINGKNVNDVKVWWHDVIVKNFWHYFVCLVNLSHWSKLHVNIIAASGIMTVFFYMGLTSNLKIRNNFVRVLSIPWRLMWVRVKFLANSNKKMKTPWLEVILKWVLNEILMPTFCYILHPLFIAGNNS